nr:hypothetical protein [Tanacetum cinerariifolium]
MRIVLNLMALCATLQNKVLGLEKDLKKTKTAHQNEIASLNRRLKKLEKKNRLRAHKLKRLYKVGLTARVESYGDEESLVSNVSVSVSAAATTVSVATTTTATKIVDDVNLAPKKKGLVIQELDESTTIISSQQSQGKGKAKRAKKKRNKPPTQAQQKKIMCTYLKNMKRYKLKDLKLFEFDVIQKMFDRAFKRKNTFKDIKTELVEGKEKRVRTELIQEHTKKKKVKDDKEIAELKKLMEIIPNEEELAIDVIHLAVKSSKIVGWKIYKEEKKSYYQIIKVDGKSQMYMIFSHMLKSFDMEDFEDLYKLVKDKYGSTRPVEDLDLLL